MPNILGKGYLRPLWFVAGSGALSLAPFWLGQELWPGGLNANAANFFWPASGFNLALVLLWGWRYAFLILLNAPLAVLLMDQPVTVSLAGAGLNVLEVLAARWVLVRFVDGLREPIHLHAIFVFCGTSLAMGVISGLPLAGILVWHDAVPPNIFWQAVSGITAANACAVLLVAPAILALARTARWSDFLNLSFAGGAGVLACVSLFLFPTVFEGRFNYAFALFPVMTFIAVRYSFSQSGYFLLLLMVFIYLGLAMNAHNLPPDKTPEILWFVQAFSWVLAATTLVLSVLVNEKKGKDLVLLNQQNELLESRLREKKAELDALRYQINPHFLHNSLNSIAAVVESEPGKARRMVHQLSDFFRETLAQPQGDLVTVEAAVGEVLRYLEIERSRHGDNLRIHVNLDPTLLGERIPCFLLQPLVENAMRHGFMQTKGTFELRIRVRPARDSRFFVEVEHPGTWKREDPGKTGVGLENIRSRLRLLYGGKAGLETLLPAGLVCQRLVFPTHAA